MHNGDAGGEAMLHEIGTGKTSFVGQRDLRESKYNISPLINAELPQPWRRSSSMDLVLVYGEC
jgi:hypothetical protein